MTDPTGYPRPRSPLRPTPAVLAAAFGLAALTISVLPLFQVLSAEQHETLDVRTAPDVVYLPPPEERDEPPPPESEPEPRPSLRTPTRAVATPAVPEVQAPKLSASLPLSGIAVQVGDLDVGTDFEVRGPPPPPPAERRTEPAPRRQPVVPDTAPVPLLTPQPAYPERARREEIEGWVDLLILVSETGEVEEVRVADANPKGVFEAACRRALKRWRFRPATKNGRPVAHVVEQRVRFQLR